MKNKALIFKRVDVNKIEYEEWKTRVQRAVTSIIKYSDHTITTTTLFMYILAGLDEYFKDIYINMINEIYNTSIKTWSETKRFLHKHKLNKK